MNKISSTSNPKIQMYKKLKKKSQRDSKGLFIIEGRHLVEEVLQNSAYLVEEIFSTSPFKNAIIVNNKVLKMLSSAKTPQGIVAVVKKPNITIKARERILILDNVQDPGNVGSLIRAAKAFNWDAVIIRGADPYNFKAIASSQGSIFSIPVIWDENIVKYTVGLKVVATSLQEHSIIYKDLPALKNIALVLGNEGSGVSKEILALCKYIVRIPVSFESLNVSQAGAILLNEYRK